MEKAKRAGIDTAMATYDAIQSRVIRNQSEKPVTEVTYDQQ